MRCGTPRRWSVIGSPWSAPGWSAAASRRILAGFPGVTVQLVDVDPGRAGVAAALGVEFAAPGEADGARDLVIHASATAAGPALALELLAPEGTVVELSWYGDREVNLPLGGSFHSGRLTHPQQPGRHGRRRPGGRAAASPTGWLWRWTCCAIPPSMRCVPASRLRRAARGAGRHGRRHTSRAVPRHHATTESERRCSASPSAIT